jgi:hypothetical protein
MNSFVRSSRMESSKLVLRKIAVILVVLNRMGS